jgi:hypothetical protein
MSAGFRKGHPINRIQNSNQLSKFAWYGIVVYNRLPELILLLSGRVVYADPCGRSPAEIVGSNPTGGMDVCLL